MIEITKEISFEEVLGNIEEVKNVGIFALILGIFAVVLVVILVCAFFDFDKLNEKRIDHLENLLEHEVEKNRALEYKVRFYCDSVFYVDEEGNKKPIRKK